MCRRSCPRPVFSLVAPASTAFIQHDSMTATSDRADCSIFTSLGPRQSRRKQKSTAKERSRQSIQAGLGWAGKAPRCSFTVGGGGRATARSSFDFPAPSTFQRLHLPQISLLALHEPPFPIQNSFTPCLQVPIPIPIPIPIDSISLPLIFLFFDSRPFKKCLPPSNQLACLPSNTLLRLSNSKSHIFNEDYPQHSPSFPFLPSSHQR